VVWSFFFQISFQISNLYAWMLLCEFYNVVLAGLINCMHDVVSHIKSAR
jgi:hypothetical protein